MSVKSAVFRQFSILLIIASMLVFGGSTSAAAKISSQEPKSDSMSLQQTVQCLGTKSETAHNAKTGKISFVGTSLNEPIEQSIKNPRSVSPEMAARGYLSNCGSLFGVNDQAAEITLKRQTQTEDGRSVVRFQQNVKGIPVFGGEIIIQMDADGNITAVVSDLTDVKLDSATPSVDVDAAPQAALEVVAKANQLESPTLSASRAELWFYDPSILEIENGPAPALVWRLEVRSTDKPINELVLVDAQTKAVLLHFNQIDTSWISTGENQPVQKPYASSSNAPAYTLGSPLISVYTMNHTKGVPPGTLVCNQSDPSLCDGDADAQTAYQYTLDTYNFYANTHGRDSIDNAGMELVSSVHYGDGYQNAFWNGSQMTYGDGWAADDVVAHELTHGVTERESALIYYGQSGAINESFSDVWGEFVDQTNTGGTDGAVYDWQLGEDIPFIGAVRDMENPIIFGDPDRMSSPYYYLRYDDNAGVHINSGVNNKAAYLMAAGGDFNGYVVTSIGIEKTARVYYEAQTSLLTSAASYIDLYNALNQACGNLEALSIVTTADCAQVNNATLAVEMNTAPVIPPTPGNDNFADAFSISTTPYSDSQITIGATTEIDDPALPCAYWPATNSVWYKYAPAADGLLILDTFYSNYNAVLAVWTGSFGELTNHGCRHSELTVLVASGETYYIEIAGDYDTGSLAFHADFKVTAPFTSCSVVTEIPELECDALVALYDATDGANWGRNFGWKEIDTPCSWDEVTCEAGHVTRLDLLQNNLVGTIPTQLGNLTNLTKLVLFFNHLSGSIPPELGNLTNLDALNLDGNQLSGTIPPELGNLTNLLSLNLSDNQLSGSIPPELGNLTSLTYLWLCNNQLSGSIPTKLGDLTNLRILWLGENQLSGFIPTKLGDLTNLRELYLDQNQLSGSTPPELGNLINLGELLLNNNQLSGSIPPELGNLVGLNELNLRENQLSGSIPPELGNLTNLYFLYLNNNQLIGSIPSGLGGLSNLYHLSLAENKLGGEIPTSLTNLSLSFLSLSCGLTSSNPVVVAYLDTKVPGWQDARCVTTITSDSPDPSLPGQVVNITVTVGGGMIIPTGTVDISGADTNCQITLSNGTGNCSVTFNTISVKALTAIYNGDPNFSGSWDTEMHGQPIFADVSSSYWAGSYIERLYNAGITGGCTTIPLNYCPTTPVTRAQMAVFLLRGMHGSTYTPPAATGTKFNDVPLGTFGAAWIEQLATEGITSGCGGGNYCPTTPVSRAQMAIFLVRAKHGIAFTPPTATGIFADVAIGSFGADYIEQLSADAITTGCGGTNYCPNTTVKRDSMAVFLVKTFNLP